MKVLLVLFAMLSIALADPTYELDLHKSVLRIQAQINITKHRPAQWDKLEGIIEDALDCLSGLGLGIFTVEDPKWMSPVLTHYIESLSYQSIGRQLQDVDWSAISAKAATASQNTQALLDDLKEFMNTTEYRTIHDHIFTHPEFLDLLRFFHRANYPDIYTNLKEFFVGMGQPNLPLPDGPTWRPPTMYIAGQFPKNGGNRLPIIKVAPPSIKVECSIEGGFDGLTPLFEIIERLNQSNIHEVIKVLLYLLQEVIGNSAMHVLLLKIGEGQKGEFVQSTLALPEMQQGLVHAHGLILSDPGVTQLNEVLKTVTGLDLGNRELFMYIVNLVKYLVWNHPFPVAETP